MLYDDGIYKNITLCVLMKTNNTCNLKKNFLYLNEERRLSTIKHTTLKLPGPHAVNDISSQIILGKNFRVIFFEKYIVSECKLIMFGIQQIIV